MSFLPIHVHTCWSILDSSLIISDFIRELKKNNCNAACITDHHNLKGSVQFYNQCKQNGIKPIIGCEVNLRKSEKEFSRVTLLAKNLNGYENLIKIVSHGNQRENIFKPEFFCENEIPSISPDLIREFASNLICLIGDLNSDPVKACFTNHHKAYRCNSDDICYEYVDSINWQKRLEEVESFYKSVFTKSINSNVFFFYNKSSLPILRLYERAIKKYTNNKAIPCNNIHMLKSDDIEIHQMLLKSSLEINKSNNELELCNDNRIFYTEENYCCYDPNLEDGYKSNFISDLVEDYSIERRPILPQFKIKGHSINDPDTLVRERCRSGFRERKLKESISNESILQRYYDRISYELDVFKKAGISSYFLIVQDLIDFAHRNGIPADVRGSSSGCMISYLLGISSINSMNPDESLSYAPERELPFERFYNEGRNTKGNVSLADIDIDIPPNFRDSMIDYMKRTYGDECVGHIITHSKFKAKGALKEVFRLMKPVPNYFEVCNDITKLFIDETKISDDIKEARDIDPDYGIINWHIDNIESISNYYSMYKEAFDLAIKIEQIPKNESVHAAGIIVADQPLRNLFPLRYSSKLDDLVIDIEGSDIEFIGGVKFDILGVAALEKVYKIQEMINTQSKECIFGIEYIGEQNG